MFCTRPTGFGKSQYNSNNSSQRPGNREKTDCKKTQTDFLGMFRLVLLQKWKCAISVEIKFWYQMMIHPCITGSADSQSHIHIQLQVVKLLSHVLIEVSHLQNCCSHSVLQTVAEGDAGVLLPRPAQSILEQQAWEVIKWKRLNLLCKGVFQ